MSVDALAIAMDSMSQLVNEVWSSLRSQTVMSRRWREDPRERPIQHRGDRSVSERPKRRIIQMAECVGQHAARPDELLERLASAVQKVVDDERLVSIRRRVEGIGS